MRKFGSLRHFASSFRLKAASLGIVIGALALSAPAMAAENGPPDPNLILPGVQALEWKTKSKRVRGTIIAVHGTTQQAGCFATLAHSLNDLGFNVIGMDLRGHGHWYFKTDANNTRHEISYSRSANDLARMAKRVRVLYPKQPLFCIGESVGAAVTVRACGEHPDLFDGIVLASAGTSPHIFNFNMVARDLVKGLSNLDRPLDVSEYITRYSSEDARITHEMVTDPLSRTMLTGKEILQTGAFIRKTPSMARAVPANVSVLMINGQLDQIVKADTTEEILKNINSTDKKLVTVPFCGHILFGTAYLKKSVVEP
ncbi:MAG TPA: alpha/beta fold hydrolase, partial [Chroococcales cyanobacterium]